MADTRAMLTTLLVEHLGVNAEHVTDEATIKALGGDSLDGVEIVMLIEEQLGVQIDDDDEEFVKGRCFRDVAARIDRLVTEKTAAAGEQVAL